MSRGGELSKGGGGTSAKGECTHMLSTEQILRNGLEIYLPGMPKISYFPTKINTCDCFDCLNTVIKPFDWFAAYFGYF